MFEIFKKKKEYLNWNSYSKRIGLLEDFAFQQSVRKHNVKMIPGVGAN